MLLTGCQEQETAEQPVTSEETNETETQVETESVEATTVIENITSMPEEYASLFNYDGYSPLIAEGEEVKDSRVAGDGIPEQVAYITSYPSDYDRPLRQFETGPSIAELSKGKVEGGVTVRKFRWEDRAFTSVYVDAESDVFGMSSEKGEQDEFIMNGGSFSTNDDGWSQNCVMTINQGILEMSGNLCFDKGQLIINDGTVNLKNGKDSLYSGNGEVTINGGMVK